MVRAQGGPYHDLLHELLGTYACYRPDVGYIQGMSFIAAVLLLNTDPQDAFVCFANLLNRPFLFSFFQLDQDMVSSASSPARCGFPPSLPVCLSICGGRVDRRVGGVPVLFIGAV